MIRVMRNSVLVAGLAVAAVMLGGCHDVLVSVALRNDSGKPVKMIEVDYPSASFGVNALGAEGEFTYRFEVHGSSALHMSFTDAAGVGHQSNGPVMKDGDQGPLKITIKPDDSVAWVR